MPVACTLTTAGAAQQLLEWEQLQQLTTRTADIAGGVAMWFSSELAGQVADLAAREAACCQFLSLTTTREDGTVRLDITSANPDAAPVIAMIAGRQAPSG